jgi:acylpyruvate hydrolase
MKLASCRHDGEEFGAVLTERGLVRVVDRPWGGHSDFAAIPEPAADAPAFAPEEVELLAPVPRPGKTICVGLNYRGHVAESKREEPEYPVLFTKFDDSVIGPFAPIEKPAESEQTDYEGELAIVIGAPARRVPREQALEVVAGYSVANDVTMRDYQYKTHQWLQGKAWPRTTPIGPYLVTGDEVDEARDLAIRLWLNGEEMQNSRTRLMIFDIPTLVSTISEFTELAPGDVILSGTPEGVGFRRDPQVFMRPGDRVRVEIEGIGAIENEVVAEAGPPGANGR